MSETIFRNPIQTRATWLASDYSDPSEWTYRLNPEQVEEILAALAHAKAKGRALQTLTREDFPLPTLADTVHEWARELSNGTVHAVMHVGWVPQRDGSYGAQLGVYVKPRGRSGRAYMAAIGPFRRLIVYPALMRAIGRAWERRRR